MKLILGQPKRYHWREAVYFTIGVFDGVHLGHRYIIKRVVREAKKANAKSLLITFFPYPQHFFNKNFSGYLTTLEEKTKILQQLGIDYVWIMKFNTKLYLKRGSDFIAYLMRHFNLRKLFIGEDFRFGYRQESGIKEIKDISRTNGFSLVTIKSLRKGRKKISSSFIRSLIEKGKLKKANNFLGYTYYFLAPVRKSGQLAGKVLGFPTANLEIGEKLLPPNGVYIVEIEIGNKCYQGIANLGEGRSLGRKNRILETHIFNFRRNIYGEYIKVVFLKKIREERFFPKIDDLRKQIENDIFAAKKYFSRHKILCP